MKFFDVVKSFFKVGVIGFGGGTALIPVVEKEVVADKKYMTPEKFSEELVLQGITPGAFPIKMGISVGMLQSPLCAAASAVAVSLFGAVATILIMLALSFASGSVLTQIGYLSVGISAFIIVLIYNFIHKTIKNSKSGKKLMTALVLFIFTIVFGSASKLGDLINAFGANIDLTYFPELATIDLILLGIVLSMFTKLQYKKTVDCVVRWAVAVSVALLFLIFCSKKPVVKSGAAVIVMYTILACLAIFAVAEDLIKAGKAKKILSQSQGVKISESIVNAHENKDFIENERQGGDGRTDTIAAVLEREEVEQNAKVKNPYKTPLLAICYIMVLPIILTIIILALGDKNVEVGKFISGCIISSATTFGGGTAFISVGEGIFVEGGLITQDSYWLQIVPISNALPGPLLIKMLGAIGFDIGMVAGAGYAYSLSLAFLGSLLGLATTVMVYLLVYMVFISFKQLTIFDKLKQGILPIIAGLLVPTIISMIANMTKVFAGTGVNVFISLPFYAVLFTLIVILTKKTKIPDFLMIIGFGGVTLGVLNVCAII